MIPLDLIGPAIRFGSAPGLQVVARRLAAITGLAVLVVLVLPGMYLRSHRIALAVAVSAFALCMIRSAWAETLEIDPDRGTYRYRRGFPRLHPREGEIADFDRVSFAPEIKTNLYGEEEPRWSVRLGGSGPSILLFRSPNEQEGRTIAEGLAYRIRVPLRESTRPEPGRPIVRRVVTWTVWSGMVAVTALIIWPVITGANRLRWSMDTGSYRPPPGFTSYRQANLHYLDRDYRAAEQLLRQAIKERPNYPDAYNLLAYAVADQNRLAEGLRTAHTALDQAPMDGNILDTVAEMYQRTRMWTTAEWYYVKALRHQDPPGVAETHVKYGQTLLALGRRRDAIPHLELGARSYDARWKPVAIRLLKDLKGPGAFRGGTPLERITLPQNPRAGPRNSRMFPAAP